jgi:hypothetical protein
MPADAWNIALKAHARDARVVVDQLVNSPKVSLAAMLLDPKDALTKIRRPLHRRVRQVTARLRGGDAMP